MASFGVELKISEEMEQKSKKEKEPTKGVEPKIKSEAMIIGDDLPEASSQRQPGQDSQKSQKSQAIEPQPSQSKNALMQHILQTAIVYFDGGQGIKKDRSLAFKFLLDAEKLGSIEAKAYLAGYYLFGESDVKIDIPFGMTLLNEGIETGSIQAKILLGICYAGGVGVSQDLNMAVKLFKEAFLSGNAKAKSIYAMLFLNGLSVPKDYAIAFKYFQEGVQSGCIIAMFKLGKCFLNGWGVSRDDAKAFGYFQKSAEAGDEEGMLFLGKCYYDGIGVFKDHAMAFKYYKEAAESGCIAAMSLLAQCYEYGDGLPKDLSLAFHWLSKATKSEDKARVTDSLRNFFEAKTSLAAFYLYGNDVVQKDISRGIQLLTECANNNYTRAKNMLGYCYENGIGVPKSEEFAFKFYKEAAEAGVSQELCNLGESFYGCDVTKSDKKSFKYLYTVSRTGHLSVHYYPGEYFLHESGIGKEIKEGTKGKETKESKEVKETKESKEVKETKESKEAREDNDVEMVPAPPIPPLEPVSPHIATMPPMVFQPPYQHQQGLQITSDNRKRKTPSPPSFQPNGKESGKEVIEENGRQSKRQKT